MRKFITYQKVIWCLFFILGTGTYGMQASVFTGTGDEQEIVVSGTVVDTGGIPLIGTSIRVEGTNNGALTDFDGKFTLSGVKEGAVLIVSYMGYETQKITVEGREEINITMKEDAQALDEVVVVGYGTQRKSDLTGSVSSVTASDIEKAPALTMDQALQGRAAGVHITSTSAEPGGGASIRIRGSNSISGNNEPLIVLDGYPLAESGEADGDSHTGQGGNPLSFLNPDEIESIEVLKDASATAIYGARGANGVVMITTKGGKVGKTRITFTSELTMSSVPDFPELLNGPDFGRLKDEERVANGNQPKYDGLDGRPHWTDLPTTDWISQILRTGASHRYQLGISGGTKASRYFISTNYTKVEGVMKYTDFNRGNIRVNLNNTLSDKLTLNTNINYARSLSNRSNEGSGYITTPGAIFNAYKANPAAKDGELSEIDDENPQFQNPLSLLREQTNETSDENLLMNIHAIYDLFPGLKLNLRAGANNKNNRRDIFWPSTTAQGELFNGRAILNTFQFNNYLLETFANYSKEIKQHHIDAAGGFSWQHNVEKRVNNGVQDFPTDNLGTDGLHLGLLPTVWATSKIKRELQSYYLRVNYNYKRKYFLTLSGRIDGSSVFSENQKYGVFPSAAVAWAVSNENFMKNSYVFSNLKLRASYGHTGSQAIPPYGSLSRLGNANYVVGGDVVSGVAPSVLGNPDLRWEKTTQADIGLDMGLFSNRLNITVDAYYKRTDDLLQDFQLSPSAGYTSTRRNIGSLENKGLEVTVSGEIGKNVVWNPNFNISFNRSEILKLGGDGSDIYGPDLARNIVAVPGNIMREGEPYGSFYGYNVIGLIQPSDFDQNGNPSVPLLNSDRGLGHWKFEDVNGDGVVTPDDRVIIGNPNPKFIFGWNNDISYKQFSLNLFFQGSYGNDMMNVDRLFIASGRMLNNQLQEWGEKRWTVENQHNNPRWPAGMEQSNLHPSSAIVEDASFIRLKNVSLRYRLQMKPDDVIRNVELYVTANNLLTITNYSGFDPEVGIFGQNNLAPGIDFASYPRARMYQFGVKIGF
ncbi:SusC/RagA family TonB-linked outer membrane protein [Sinomicrobium soli]|uniref:SusC/RagA family TonB-linked outer membrane protein n=1 Tax=Sinomicrobium sp. N-1-3-6 TaxID=2219864 RepID=UPI000DCDC077|nr:TonB-dependent receptor [Sinomicrobium sp. N-1-3-6]RAV27811.1 SusC/RagA family TonB-linked outer membrane protein [Sinomicrobium sp. N-1-3-6]